jgi:hypothetical protein
MRSIDWDAIEIESRWEEEGTQEIFAEKDLYGLLGLSREDEEERNRREEGCPNVDVDSTSADNGADRGIEDYLPDERRIVYDKDDPVIELGSTFPSMKEFRLALRQYAINREFELGNEKTDSTRHRAFCRGDNCPWRLNARLESKGSPTIIVSTSIFLVLILLFVHCLRLVVHCMACSLH